MTDTWLRGVHAAPNIQGDPGIYEVENRALDPQGLLLAAMRAHKDWRDKLVVDLGAGTGFWVPHIAREATHVFAIEPHGPSRQIAMRDFAHKDLVNTSVLAGSAAQTMLADQSVDIVHARFAYFWGPGCEPGLDELERIIRPGGVACIIDNDLDHGTFAEWLKRLPPSYQRHQPDLDTFWSAHGFAAQRIQSCWRFDAREDLEAVVHLEFADAAPDIIASHEGLEVDYHFRIYSRTY